MTEAGYGNQYAVQVDPSLLVYGTGGHDLPIDPALFAIERVVNDVRKGKIKPEIQDAREAQRSPGLGQGGHDGAGGTGSSSNTAMGTIPEHLASADTGLDMLDEEFDPALREIVNSLTNAQQVGHSRSLSPSFRGQLLI